MIRSRGSRECDALRGMSFGCSLPLPSLTRLSFYEVCRFISDALDTKKYAKTVISTQTLLLPGLMGVA